MRERANKQAGGRSERERSSEPMLTTLLSWDTLEKAIPRTHSVGTCSVSEHRISSTRAGCVDPRHLICQKVLPRGFLDGRFFVSPGFVRSAVIGRGFSTPSSAHFSTRGYLVHR